MFFIFFKLNFGRIIQNYYLVYLFSKIVQTKFLVTLICTHIHVSTVSWGINCKIFYDPCIIPITVFIHIVVIFLKTQMKFKIENVWSIVEAQFSFNRIVLPDPLFFLAFNTCNAKQHILWFYDLSRPNNWYFKYGRHMHDMDILYFW